MKTKTEIMQSFTLEDLKNPVTKASIIKKLENYDKSKIQSDNGDAVVDDPDDTGI